MWAVIGKIAAVAGILGLGITIGYFVGESRVVERVCVPDVKITALEFNGNRVTDFAQETKVPREVTVWGESEDLPNADESWEDLTIWACVMPSNGRYYPQREPVDWQGRWQLDKVAVGTEGPRDAGKQFSICVVVAEKDASRILFDDATVYHRGLPRLPNRAIISDQIVVIREEIESTEAISVSSTPSGPSSGNIDQPLTYSSGGASSNLGHSLQYRFDWGDGAYSSWSSSSTASHSWSSANTYTVRAQARCSTHTSVTSIWSAGKSVTISAVHWSVSREGNVVEIAYGSGSHFPQFAALHLDSGFFRMNYGPESSWGTSIMVVPSFWEGGTLYQGASVSSTWEIVDSNLVLSIDGTISGLNVNGEIRLSPPTDDSISATVMIDVDGDVELDDRPGEAFKLVTLASMHISSDLWDAQSAFAGSNWITIPTSSWILDPPVTDRLFGLQGGTSGWKVNAPTIAVSLDRDVTITGWVTPSNDPNDDNVAFWGALETVIPSWQYTVTARP